MSAPRKAPAGWPVLASYAGDRLARVAMPLGGIGTGTVSLGGRGDLRDWEVGNRPAKGFVPEAHGVAPGFALWARPAGGAPVARLLEGPLPIEVYEGDSGSRAPNHGFPRFRRARFEAAYPLARVRLADPDVPLDVALEAFNPLVPGDADASGLPVALLRFVLRNRTARRVDASVCGLLPNFVGRQGAPDDAAKGNRNAYREADGLRGLFLYSRGVPRDAEAWGTLALATPARGRVTWRTAWPERTWGQSRLEFWDDFSADGALGERRGTGDRPMASLAVRVAVPPRAAVAVPFVLAWHFPNRRSWTARKTAAGRERRATVGNFYATRFRDAWAAAAHAAARWPELERRTVAFVRAFCASDLPRPVGEAALFNLGTLRSQTCFRTPDGRLFGWEGCHDRAGCCPGSCTHVWNYETATPFLFGELARGMRDTEFRRATAPDGFMAFRVPLPLRRASADPERRALAAADGQMGCLVKLHREWQLSGDTAWLRALWPRAKRALAYAWIPGGWDADRDGVMEGCQHNTMDVEYYGPNPQMGGWYLAALRAAEEMARALGDDAFAARCRALFERGRAWTDRHLFNGEYYEHQVRPPRRESAIAPNLRSHWSEADLRAPPLQLGAGCLVDQLIGPLLARVGGLGELLDPRHVRATLRAIVRHNTRRGMWGHFNPKRSYALGDERAVLMASYPRGRRPARPFPYYAEVMTGFEHALAAHLVYEGMEREGLRVVADVRARYDGRRRSPFDEAECGHHYARAMASWTTVLAWTGFGWSGVTGTMRFAARPGRHFWSNGSAWGTCELRRAGRGWRAALRVAEGRLALRRFELADGAARAWPRPRTLGPGAVAHFGAAPPPAGPRDAGRGRRHQA